MEQNDVKVSVIMLTYNHEAFIQDAIYGVVRQETNFSIELIVGDDASTDKTPQLVRELAEKYPDIIKPVLREKNIGALKNYRDLIRRSRGTFVAICDGDDFWTDMKKLQKQIDFLENNPEYISCCHPVKQVYVDGSQEDTILDPLKLAGENAQKKGYLDIYDLIKMNTVASLSTVHRWSIDRELPEWMEKYSVGDYPLLLFHADKGKVGVVPELMGVYRKHSSGSWWNHTQTVKQRMDYIDLLNDIDTELSLKYHDEFAAIVNCILAEISVENEQIADTTINKPKRRNILRRILGKIYRFLFRYRIAINNLQRELADVETKMLNLESRQAGVETKIVNLDTKQAETEIKVINMEGRQNEAEAKMIGLEGKQAESEIRIVNTEGRLSESEIRTVNTEGRLSESEIKIVNIQSELGEATQKIRLLWDGIKEICRVTEYGKPSNFRDTLRYYFAIGNFNEFYDNYDKAFTVEEDIVSWINHVKQDFGMTVDVCMDAIPQEEFVNLEKTYSLLEDEKSKDIFVRLIAWKIVGFTKIKLLSDAEILAEDDNYSIIENSLVKAKENINDVEFELKCYDLGQIGYPIKCYAIPESIIMDFIRKQYENEFVKIDFGDCVIDCGACWGDTALLFATQCGERGKVISFEFVPSNIDIFNLNMEMNSEISKVITLAPYAVSDISYQEIEFCDDGTSTSIVIEKDVKRKKQKAQTITIDEYARKERLEKVDFIKMDIEGAEVDALKGCKETIQNYGPKLAISIYHKRSDMWEIPLMIQEMNPNYKFYIKHNSRSSLETILFAKL